MTNVVKSAFGDTGVQIVSGVGQGIQAASNDGKIIQVVSSCGKDPRFEKRENRVIMQCYVPARAESAFTKFYAQLDKALGQHKPPFIVFIEDPSAGRTYNRQYTSRLDILENLFDFLIVHGVFYPKITHIPTPCRVQ